MNILLVHGAWCDGSSWSDVIPLLQGRGHEVVAVQNPLTSLEDDVETTRRALAALDGPTVLAGHSYGGTVVTTAGDAPNVTALVYIAAFVPDAGQSTLDAAGDFPPAQGVLNVRVDDDGFSLLDRNRFAELFAGDLDPTRGAVLAAVQHPTAAACTSTPIAAAAWREHPARYLVSSEDHVINPDAQRAMATRAGAEVAEVASSHASPLSHPHQVADTILAATA